MGWLGQTHSKKKWQTLSNQVKQNETERVDTYHKKNLI